jgi:signal peptide peptidase-like protein 2B
VDQSRALLAGPVRSDLASIVSENGPPSSDGPITEGAMACDPIDIDAADEVATVVVQTALRSPPPSKGYLCTTTTLRIRHPSGHRKGGRPSVENAATPPSAVAMATDHRVSLLPFAAALLVLLLAGGAAADDASSSDDAGTSRTPGCSNKFQLVMACPCSLLTRFAVLPHFTAGSSWFWSSRSPVVGR